MLVPYLRGYGVTRYLSDDAPRNGQQSVLAVDAIALMDALGVDEAIVGGFDWGARTANVMAALWPERCRAMVSVSGYLIGSQAAGEAPLPPAAELAWWHQYYFATERGRAGYEAHRHDFARLIWRDASPAWRFDDAAFERSAAAFDNPNHVAVVIHNYRWRLSLAAGEPQFDVLEQRLAAFPPIFVPTITLEGDANRAPHPEPAAYAARFTGKYLHRTLTGGICRSGGARRHRRQSRQPAVNVALTTPARWHSQPHLASPSHPAKSPDTQTGPPGIRSSLCGLRRASWLSR